MNFLRGLFGGSEDKSEEEPQKETAQKENAQKEAEPEQLVFTTDEAFQAMIRGVQKEKAEKDEDYTSTFSQLFAPPPSVTEQQVAQSKEAGQTEEEDKLPEDATVKDLVDYVTKQVIRRVRSEIEPLIRSVASPSSVVENIVRSNDALRSVASDAEKLLSQLPVQFQTKETAQILLWVLKGMRAEAEKRQAVAEALGSVIGEPERVNQPAVLPFSNADLERWASQMGISVERLKKRIAEEIAKGNTLGVK